MEARGGAAGAEDDIDTEGVVGGVADLVGDGVVADRAGAIDAAAPAGVFGVEALGDALREGGGREPGARIAGLGGDLLHDGEAVGRMRDGGAGQGEGAGPQRERGGGERRVIDDGGCLGRGGAAGERGGGGGAGSELMADLVERPARREGGQHRAEGRGDGLKHHGMEDVGVGGEGEAEFELGVGGLGVGEGLGGGARSFLARGVGRGEPAHGGRVRVAGADGAAGDPVVPDVGGGGLAKARAALLAPADPRPRDGEVDDKRGEGGARGGHGFAGRGDDQVPILDDEAAPEPGDEAAEELVVGFGGLDARGEDPAAHRGGDGGVQIRAGGDGLGDRGQGLPSPAHVARLAQGRGGVDGRGLQSHRAGGGVTGEAAEREAAPEMRGSPAYTRSLR